MSNLIDLAKQCPDVNITVKAGELLEMVEYCVSLTQTNLEQMITDASTEKYLSTGKAAELLEVDKSTLWRWNKEGYLKHISIGGSRRYRMSDIKKILEG
jgi:excisionase family DNA binding protein